VSFFSVLLSLLAALCVGEMVWTLVRYREEILWRARLSPHTSKRRLNGARSLAAFSDFVELVALCLSAGMDVERAWSAALAQTPVGDLKSELTRVANDLALGRGRTEALAELAARLDDFRLRSVITLVVHALKRGTPLEKILLDEAERLRGAHLAALEKRAQTAGVRILFPLVFLIVPTIFIVLFGPSWR
jgi:tight adherence protein C